MIVLVGGKRGLVDAQRQHLEGVHCILHSTQLPWHLLPYRKYGFSILEKFAQNIVMKYSDLPDEPVKTRGKGTWARHYIYRSTFPFVRTCVNLLPLIL